MSRLFQRTILLLAFVSMWILGAVACLSAAEEAPNRANLGRSVKLRILVDKVMQPTEGWISKEWMVKATAEAGFNVFSPRKGHDNLNEVREVTRWCRKYGIYHMPWMRGSLTAPAGKKADGKRMVWSTGGEQPLWSPNSDEFWEWTERYILEYAKISAKDDHLMGVFLDYENYASGMKGGNLYSLSYDDIILSKFAEARGIELPKLELAKRKEWLVQQKLHESFSQFQIEHWRKRCRSLRKAVDQIEPTFQFCIYPAPGTPFMREALYREWASRQAPLILADPWVYGRPTRFMPQDEALRKNKEKLLNGMKFAQEAGISFLYAGGIDPVVRGADPEFSGKNAVMISETTDGYWIFYEGLTYTKNDHAQYWKWFTWANRAIAEKNFNAWHEPRQTDENWLLDMFGTVSKGPHLLAPQTTGKKKSYPLVKLRGDNLLLLVCKARQNVSIALQNHPVGSYTSPLVWDVRGPKLSKVASGSISFKESGEIRFNATVDGVYLLGLTAGGCAYSVNSSNVPIGLNAVDKLSLIGQAKRLYFKVPQGLKQFQLHARGSGAETVRVNIFSATGNLVVTGQTKLDSESLNLKVPVEKSSEAVWSLEITRADQGVLEDSSIRLDKALAPILSLVPEETFGRASPKK